MIRICKKSSYTYIFDPSEVDLLEVGQRIEIQFTFNPQDCFGWWVGYVAELVRSPDSKFKEVKVRFQQHAEEGMWAYETLSIGLQRKKSADRDAMTGGFRIVTQQDEVYYQLVEDYYGRG
jgi:hypothetical protein